MKTRITKEEQIRTITRQIFYCTNFNEFLRLQKELLRITINKRRKEENE